MNSTITAKLQTIWRAKRSAWESKATDFETAMKFSICIKINRKAAEVLWLVSANPFLDAMQQDGMVLNKTKFKLLAQGWLLNFSPQPVWKPVYLSNMGLYFHSVFPDKERGWALFVCPGKVCIRVQEFRRKLNKLTKACIYKASKNVKYLKTPALIRRGYCILSVSHHRLWSS